MDSVFKPSFLSELSASFGQRKFFFIFTCPCCFTTRADILSKIHLRYSKFLVSITKSPSLFLFPGWRECVSHRRLLPARFVHWFNILRRHAGHLGSIHPPRRTPPIIQIIGSDTCWENQSISGWMERERQGQINVQILIRAAMHGDYTTSEVILPLSLKRLGIEMSCWVRCECICTYRWKNDNVT